MIWPLAAPENQGFRKLGKFPREGKDLGKLINSICEEARCCQVCWERRLLIFLCCYEHYWVSVRQEESVGIEGNLWGEVFQVRPHGFMVRLGGESCKWFWLPYSTVGRNVVVPFVFPHIGSDMQIFSCFVWMICVSEIMHLIVLSWNNSMDDICS